MTIKYFVCSRCGSHTYKINKQTGFCDNCFSETGMSKKELRDKNQDHFEFRVRMIQKVVIKRVDRPDVIQYKIEIPTSVHYRVRDLGREQEFIIHVIARGK